MDLKIALESLPTDMRVMIDVPHMGESFKFADIVAVERTEIDSHEGYGTMEIVMITPYEMDISEN